MKLTIAEILEVIKRSTLKNPQDEEDYGYCHALFDLERTFKEIEEGKRSINGDWLYDKNDKRPKRKQSRHRNR